VFVGGAMLSNAMTYLTLCAAKSLTAGGFAKSSILARTGQMSRVRKPLRARDICPVLSKLLAHMIAKPLSAFTTEYREYQKVSSMSWHLTAMRCHLLSEP